MPAAMLAGQQRWRGLQRAGKCGLGQHRDHGQQHRQGEALAQRGQPVERGARRDGIVVAQPEPDAAGAPEVEFGGEPAPDLASSWF
jgi:hypothetical protein